MANYDFKNLSPHDFEILCRDLLNRHLSVRFQTFSAGRDQGVDLKYDTADGGHWIAQCKHYANSRYNHLFRELEKEVVKVENLQPERYFISTSQNLTSNNKMEILDLFSPYLSSANDVFSSSDLNYLLGEFPDIERRHFKLWLPSTEILKFYFSAKSINRAEAFLLKLSQEYHKFANTSSYDQAIELLSENSFCIITGMPGTGKTTLAKIIILEYLKEGFELVHISSDIDEAFELFNKDSKQIFYFDDFLGKTRIDLSHQNRDQRILDFINLLSTANDSRLILTTREYILNQSISYFDEFEYSKNKILKNRCFVSTSSYSLQQREAILHNHVFYTNKHILSGNPLRKIAAYKSIIQHKNFLPRIIEWTTENYEGSDETDLLNLILENLNFPSQVWKSILDKHLTIHAQYLVALIYFYQPYSTKYDILKQYYSDIESEIVRSGYYSNYATEFDYVLQEINRSMISIEGEGQNTTVKFQNPSILDFLSRYYLSNPAKLIFIINNITSTSILWLALAKSEEARAIRFGDIGSNGLSNKMTQTAIAERLNHLMKLDVSPKDGSQISISQIVQYCFIILSNHSLYDRSAIEIAKGYILQLFENEDTSLIDYLNNKGNAFAIAKSRSIISISEDFAISHITSMILEAGDLSDVRKILSLDKIIGHPEEIQSMMIGSITELLYEEFRHFIDDEGRDQDEIDDLLDICMKIIDYGYSDTRLDEITKELNDIKRYVDGIGYSHESDFIPPDAESYQNKNYTQKEIIDYRELDDFFWPIYFLEED